MSAAGRALLHQFVIPAYKESPFLGACLESLRAQTPASPILVTTSTPSAFIDCVAAGSGATVIANPGREGIAADWNFALGATHARYVTLAHQDDLYFPGFTEESLRLLKASGAPVCFTGYEQVDDKGAAMTSKISRVKHLIEATTLGAGERPAPWRMRAFLSFGNPLPCSAVTYDRDQLADFAFSDEFASNLDWEAWLRLHHLGKRFVRTPRRLVGRRHNPLTETSRLILDGRRAHEDALMFRQLWPRPIGAVLARLYRAGY